MLVAYNLAFFRKAAGLTQEEFGEHIGGWSKVAVSAAERSWDGKRVRQFDADLVADIAAVLGIPISAMYLPPEDDGITHRYLLYSERSVDEPLTMQAFFNYVMSDPLPDETPALRAYDERLALAVSNYLDSDAAEELARRMKELATEQQFAAALVDARRNRSILEEFGEAIEDVIADNDLLQDALTRALKATPEGRALIAERKSAWSALPPAHQAWQAQLVEIGRELFGDLGHMDRGQIDRIIEEAQKRSPESQKAAAAVLLTDDGSYKLVEPDEPGEEP